MWSKRCNQKEPGDTETGTVAGDTAALRTVGTAVAVYVVPG